MAYEVNLKEFQGPLDLLLHLIEQAEVDIKDIFISEITAQYLEYMGQIDTLDMDTASEFLTMAALIERQCYPVNAKYYLNLEGLHMGLHSRVKNAEELSETFKKEVKMLRNLSERMEKSLKR